MDFTDEGLAAEEQAHRNGGFANRTIVHTAHVLRRLQDPAQRKRAYFEGCTLRNILGGRASDWIPDAVSAILEKGPEVELYGERYAREEIERQRARRDAELAAAAAYARRMAEQKAGAR